MTKTIIVLLGAALTCYGRPQKDDGSLHVVYSKMLSEVRSSQAEPRTGVAYVYSVSATEPSPSAGYTSFSSDYIVPQGIDAISVQKTKSFSKEISVGGKISPLKNIFLASKQRGKDSRPTYSPIDPLDLNANES